MPTKNQLIKSTRKKKVKRLRRKLLNKNPQRKGICTRISLMSPNKPNAGKRRVVRVAVSPGGKKAVRVGRSYWIYIPGEGGHNLQIYSNVLIRGGRVQDLPIHYKGIRNKYDLNPVVLRKSARSKYGIKNDIALSWKKKKKRRH